MADRPKVAAVLQAPATMIDVRPDLVTGRFVWVASYPKSGSTWLRMFLSAYLFGEGSVDINDPRGMKLGDITREFYEAVSSVPLDELYEYESFLLRPAALAYASRFVGGDAILKTHCAFARVCGVDLIPVELTNGAIYVVRDPRDIVVSYARHANSSIDYQIDTLNRSNVFTTGTERNLCQFLGSWSDHVNSWTKMALKSNINVLRVKYEDMCTVPATVFANVVRWLKKDIDEPLLERSIFATRFSRLQAQESNSGFLEKPPDMGGVFFRSGKIGEWRDVLTTSQVSEIEKKHEDAMKDCGYLS